MQYSSQNAQITCYGLYVQLFGEFILSLTFGTTFSKLLYTVSPAPQQMGAATMG